MSFMPTRRRLTVAGLAIPAMALCGGALRPALAQPEVLTLSTNNTPLDRKALERLSQEIGRRLGLGFKVVGLPSERSLQAANQGEVDGEGLRVGGLGAQYPNLVQVEARFIGVSFVAFARDAGIVLDRGWDSLKPHRVAFITGWKLFEAQATGARVVHKVDRPEQLFQMLDAGRIDLALYTRADGESLARHMGVKAVALTPSLRDADMFLYLNRRHASLAPRVARALREMLADGSHARILAAVAAE